jgi:hypothetical protein
MDSSHKHHSWWAVTFMHKVWDYLYRIAGTCLAITVAALISVPAASPWKSILGVVAAITGVVFMAAMFFARRPGGTQETQVLNRELKQYPPEHGHDTGHDHDVEH